ncbi:B3GNTL1 protein [Besnoitia besnoiti]|uniref:B3GNTL1 protein n=1 Tax=Besnoitia besnoiti TaxID=94643 RepID=A0A2A9M8G3_BESBE|nr:B3GNTL1 protein [Besnoitia besnoiti]PFH32206.1 B3GNTL1 protein [Besnoitia besnoiti]
MELDEVSDLLHLDPRDTQCPLFPTVLYRSSLYADLAIPLPRPASPAHADSCASSSLFSASTSRSAAAPLSPCLSSSSASSYLSPSTGSGGVADGHSVCSHEATARRLRVPVSVIITVRNGAAFIEAALDSLLAQSFVSKRQRAKKRKTGDGEEATAGAASPSSSAATAEALEGQKSVCEESQTDGSLRTQAEGDSNAILEGEGDEANARPAQTRRTEEDDLPSFPPSAASPGVFGVATSSGSLGAFSASAASGGALEGDNGPLEICVFDDGSTDATLSLLLDVIAPRCLERHVLLTVAAAPGADISASSPSSSSASPSSSSPSSGSSASSSCSSSAPYSSSSSALSFSSSSSSSSSRSSSSSLPVRASGGVGYGRNKAVMVSAGEFLCFMDADDESFPERIAKQLQAAKMRPNTIVGSGFVRDPPESTPRYTHWLNTLSEKQLLTSRFRECTLLMPTWFMPREVFERRGGFLEGGKLRFLRAFQSELRAQTAAQKGLGNGDAFRPLALPEDLLFLYRHVREGGRLCRVPEPLYLYKYHENCTSFRVSSDLLWAIRVREFQEQVMQTLHPRAPWIIWSIGRDGKRFYRSLSPANRERVIAFVDIDKKKVSRKVYADPLEPLKGRQIPIHFWEDARRFLDEPDTERRPVFVICVKYEMPPHNTLEQKLQQLQMKEGQDFFFFC